MSAITPKKIGENQYLIEADSNLGMKVPVKIYADEELLQKSQEDELFHQNNKKPITKIQSSRNPQ